MYNVDDYEKKELVVVEYKELVFIFVVFVFIFFALFPKDLLKEQILSKDNDYELSMTYLKNLIIHDPTNESLRLILAKKAIQKGDLPLANKLLQALQLSQNTKIANEALLLGYEVQKQRYFQTKDKNLQAQLYPQIKRMFNQIFALKLYDTNYKKWYEDATFLGHTHARLFFIAKLIEKEPTNIKLLRDGYYIATQAHNAQLQEEYLNRLLVYDTLNKSKWALAKYYFLLQHNRYDQAQQLLESFAQEDTKFKKLLADFYLMRQHYDNAATTYEELLNDATTYKQKNTFSKKRSLHSKQVGS